MSTRILGQQLVRTSLSAVRRCAALAHNDPSAEVLKKATVQPAILKECLDESLQKNDYFKFGEKIKIEDMFRARVHYGHKVGTVNDKMKWALFGERLGVCIFELEKTRQCLVTALNFVAHIAMRGGIFLFVSSNRNSLLTIEERVMAEGEYVHVRKWCPNTLTDSGMMGAPARLPDTIIFLSSLTTVLETHPAVREAAKMVIPTVAIVDSNADPTYITYPVPGNDDSRASVIYFLERFLEAIRLGKDARKRMSVESSPTSKSPLISSK